TSGTRATVDSRLLEDAPGAAAFAAEGDVEDVDVTWFSAPYRYPAPSGRPLSRGRPCDVGVPDGRPLSQQACWTGDSR
ncbi:hypothetical protein ACXWOD_11265, partial [Streptococcus pyogenes]